MFGGNGRFLMLYVSKPQHVEAVQFTGDPDEWHNLVAVAGDKVRMTVREKEPGVESAVELLAGKDGAQGWVPVPKGHWIVHPPDDLSDIWPVEDAYFTAKYEAVA